MTPAPIPHLVKQPLSPAQARVYECIVGHFERTGLMPTITEIGRHCGFTSKNGAHEHLEGLVRKGWIERDPGVTRGIRLLQEPAALDAEERTLLEGLLKLEPSRRNAVVTLARQGRRL